MSAKPKAYLVGGGIGSLAAAAFMIRDGNLPGENISILEAMPVMGGSLDGAGDPDARIFHARRTHADDRQLRMHVGSLQIHPLADQRRASRYSTKPWNSMRSTRRIRWRGWWTAVAPRSRSTSMGFSMQDRIELLKLSRGRRRRFGAQVASPTGFRPASSRRSSGTCGPPHFAFQPWHSAVEFKRYLLRFMLEFSRIETLAGVKRTIYNQYDSLVLPLAEMAASARRPCWSTDCKVTGPRSQDGGRQVHRDRHPLSSGRVRLK